MFEPPEFSNRHRLESAMAGLGVSTVARQRARCKARALTPAAEQVGATGDIEHEAVGRSRPTSGV
jgi:hypothetical protein